MSTIFGIGFHKTGTSSLGRAFEYLGYRVQGHVPTSGIEDAKRKARTYRKGYDVLQDTPWPVLYEWLDHTYPGSQFILTVRPEDEWIDSVCRHFGGSTTTTREWMYDGAGDPMGNEDLYLDTYRRHNEDVLDYFGDRRGDDLLVMDITQGDGWSKLCSFLGCATPWLPFPHGKLSEARRQRMSCAAQVRWRCSYFAQSLVIHYWQGRLLRRIAQRL
jgi:hypothetical protein